MREGPTTTERGVVWLAPDGVRLLAPSAVDPRALDDAELEQVLGPPGRLRIRCDPSGCGEHGDGKALYLIDGASERLLARNLSEVHGGEIIGDHAYWVTYGPYGMGGNLSRAALTGGGPETLWSGTGVTEMIVDGTTIYFASEDQLVAYDTVAGRTRVLVDGAVRPKHLFLRDGRVFWSELGNPHSRSEPSGALRSISLATGEVTTHAAPVPWPSLLHVDDARLYWASRDQGLLRAVPRTGGDSETVADLGPGCGGILWMDQTSAGLLLLRGDELSMMFGQPAELWLVPAGS
ncbi:MAG: hypothetical protein H6709_10215 [Kofleriaceae bacterium]|nr:hypothetical protein [Myxococcales bacterium]MCB9564037.1 hypothetical protein [Kofleriaceae bacterium]MCB9572449.1 hypothetical protein [Kofleriaceae bacterium]